MVVLPFLALSIQQSAFSPKTNFFTAKVAKIAKKKTSVYERAAISCVRWFDSFRIPLRSFAFLCALCVLSGSWFG
jgi:hypothetical protein